MSNPPIDIEDPGEALKKARTQKGLSLESVQQKTRISRKFLEAMESNRFQDLPAPVYLRGFLRTYCEFLGLDFDAVWARISSAVEKPAPPAASTSEPSGPPSGGLWLGLAVAALAVGGLWLTARHPAPRTTPPPAPKEAAPITPLHPKGERTLELEFPARTWVRVEVDGRLRFEGWAPAGARQKWTADERFGVRTASPENVRTVLDGKPAPLASYPRSGDDFTIEAPPAQ